MGAPAVGEPASLGSARIDPRADGLPSRREGVALRVQRAAGWMTAVVWLPLSIALMRFGFGWRIEDTRELRRLYREARRDGAPLLICANHLTMFDSAVIAWALGGAGTHLRDFGGLPWNTPERANFAASRAARVLVYLTKCLPIARGQDRRASAAVLDRAAWLLGRGEAVLIFPEGGRSRTGRVDGGSAAHGVGRLVSKVPGCRVLCVYLRGDAQEGMSDLAARGEHFRVRAEIFTPHSDARGVRRSVELVRQIVGRLAAMEQRVLAERG